MNWETQTPNATSYIIFLFIFGLVVPMIVIIYCYTQISITMRKTKRNTKLCGQVERAERRVNFMIILMVAGDNWFKIKRNFPCHSNCVFSSWNSFPGCLDTICGFRIDRTVWRSQFHNSCSCSHSSNHCKIKYFLQSYHLRRNEFTSKLVDFRISCQMCKIFNLIFTVPKNGH